MRSEDIAKLAGVSRSTVSRVINKHPNVLAETRDKVKRIMEQHEYEPNTSARALAGKGTKTIGLFIVSIADTISTNRIYQNNYFAPFVEAIVDTANFMGYYVLIHTIQSQDGFAKVKQSFLQKRFDGCIMVGIQRNIEVIREIAALGAPFVLVDYDIAEVIENRLDKNNLAIINSRDYEGAEEAVKYLIDLGHREIGIMNGRINTFSGLQRYKAFESILKENGLRLNEAYVLNGEFIKQTAYNETKRLIQSGKLPTAIFYTNDDMAIAAMEAFTEAGIRVPEDISIVGFDDVPVASLLVPSLSSVRLPILEMSKEAVSRMISMCEQNSISFSTISFRTQLIVRASCRSLE